MALVLTESLLLQQLALALESAGENCLFDTRKKMTFAHLTMKTQMLPIRS